MWLSWTYFGAVIVCGRHCCGRHGLAVIVLRVAVMDFFGGPLSFVAVMDLAVIVCGRYGLAVIVLRVAVMDLFWGRYRLWPSWIWPSLFVAVMDLAVIVFHVAVMVCGRHSRSPPHQLLEKRNCRPKC